MNLFLSLLAACSILCSCADHKAFPTTNADEVKWKEQYRNGEITWSEYQDRLKSEKQP